MNWSLVGKFASRRLAALLIGLFFIDRISNISPNIEAYVMGGITAVFIACQCVENCVLKIMPADNGQTPKTKQGTRSGQADPSA